MWLPVRAQRCVRLRAPGHSARRCAAIGIRPTPRSHSSLRAWSLLTRWLATALLLIVVLAAISAAGCGGSGGTSTGGSAAPKPGATLKGPVQISGKASSAVISLVVSADGASISSVGVILNDLETETFSAESMTKEVTGSIPITDGTFSGELSGLGTIEGRFNTPTEASGKVKLNVEIPYSVPADLGEFTWTASTQ